MKIVHVSILDILAKVGNSTTAKKSIAAPKPELNLSRLWPCVRVARRIRLSQRAIEEAKIARVTPPYLVQLSQY